MKIKKDFNELIMNIPPLNTIKSRVNFWGKLPYFLITPSPTAQNQRFVLLDTNTGDFSFIQHYLVNFCKSEILQEI